jgi:hypothetical protein
MTVAARQIDWEAWSQSRFLAWAETQPEGCRYEFDGFRPVAMAPATVGHNRIGRNIRETIRPRLPAGAPCDTYGPQDAIETVGGALREPDAFIACSRPHRNAVAVPAPIVVFEVISPGRGNQRRDEEKVDEYESVPRYSAMLSLNPRVGHSVPSGANLVSRRGTGKLPTRPGQSACRNLASSFHLPRSMPGSTSIEVGGSCGCCVNESERLCRQ